MPLETCPICLVRLPRELLSAHKARAHAPEDIVMSLQPVPDGPPPPESAYQGDRREPTDEGGSLVPPIDPAMGIPTSGPNLERPGPEEGEELSRSEETGLSTLSDPPEASAPGIPEDPEPVGSPGNLSEGPGERETEKGPRESVGEPSGPWTRAAQARSWIRHRRRLTARSLAEAHLLARRMGVPERSRRSGPHSRYHC